MSDDIGAATPPGPLFCGEGCGKEATVMVLTIADREAEYICWPCLIGRCCNIAMQLNPDAPPADA